MSRREAYSSIGGELVGQAAKTHQRLPHYGGRPSGLAKRPPSALVNASPANSQTGACRYADQAFRKSREAQSQRRLRHGAASRNAPELAHAVPLTKPGRLPLEPTGRFYAGRLQVPAAGTLVITIASPRPVRFWLDGELALDEGLFWRYYQRQLHAAIVFPCARGELPLVVEVGPRPRHPEGIDRDCPSRNRDRVMRELEKRLPDVLTVTATVTPAVTLPAMSLRFQAAQCHRDGTTYQHFYVRLAKGVGEPPYSVPAPAIAKQPTSMVQAVWGIFLRNPPICGISLVWQA